MYLSENIYTKVFSFADYNLDDIFSILSSAEPVKRMIFKKICLTRESDAGEYIHVDLAINKYPNPFY